VSKIYIGLGSNLGNKKNNLETALIELKKIAIVNKVSSLYQSSPWGYKNQEDFYNAVVEVDVDLSPQELLDRLKEIEAKFISVKSVRWGPRIIDLDILLYDQQIVDSPQLKIPHPEIKNRIFVLIPLLELNSELIDPDTKIKFLEEVSLLKSNEEVNRIAFFNEKERRWNEDI